MSTPSRQRVRSAHVLLWLALGCVPPISCVDTTQLPSVTASPEPVLLPIGGTATVVLISTLPAGVALTPQVPTGITAALSSGNITAGQPVQLTLTAIATLAPGRRQLHLNTSNGYIIDVRMTILIDVVEPFELDAAASLSVRAGSMISNALRINRVAGFDSLATLAFTDMPMHSVGTFSESPTSLSSVPYSISTLGTTPLGTSRIRIIASSAGVSRSIQINLEVTAPILVPVLSLQLRPAALSMTTSATGFIDIDIGRTGPVGNVDFTATGAPVGVTTSFAPASAPDATRRLSLATNNAAPGTHDITVTGTANSGSLVKSEVLRLTVVPQCTVLMADFASGSVFATTVASQTGGASETSAYTSSGGNPGGYLRMTHTLPSPSSIVVDHMFPTSYDPSAPASGAIATVEYREDRIQLAPPFPSAAVGAGFIVKQGSTRYLVPLTNGIFSGTTWANVPFRILRATDLPGVNFTASAPPVQFGFYRSNSNNPGGSPIVITHGIDNWEVRVCR